VSSGPLTVIVVWSAETATVVVPEATAAVTVKLSALLTPVVMNLPLLRRLCHLPGFIVNVIVAAFDMGFLRVRTL
jgi:hypothetical protein